MRAADRALYFPFTRCVSALPAIDFCAGVDFGLLRAFAAFEPTILLVVSFDGFLVSIVRFLVKKTEKKMVERRDMSPASAT